MRLRKNKLTGCATVTIGRGKIAGNQFAYCNRFRVSDYLGLFEESGFNVCCKEVQEDKKARRSMEDGFMIDEIFWDYKVDDLCATGLRVTLKAGRKNGILI